MTAMAYRVYELPWTLNADDERRFRRIVRNVMLAILVFGIVQMAEQHLVCQG